MHSCTIKSYTLRLYESRYSVSLFQMHTFRRYWPEISCARNSVIYHSHNATAQERTKYSKHNIWGCNIYVPNGKMCCVGRGVHIAHTYTDLPFRCGNFILLYLLHSFCSSIPSSSIMQLMAMVTEFMHSVSKGVRAVRCGAYVCAK